jgi:serine/threonine protein kinase/Tfp pilus assembly protein PilF
MSLDQQESYGGSSSASVNSVDYLSSLDDPKVASVLAGYLAELEAGRRPSRAALLESNPEIAGAIAECLDVMEFVHLAAGARSGGGQSLAGDAFPPETILGDYVLIGEIGRGGMGIVYEARHVYSGERVALKVLSPTAALDPKTLQRFRLETQAVAQLHHPHIVPILAVGGERGAQFYAMPFIDGTTLAEVIRTQRQCPRYTGHPAESESKNAGANGAAGRSAPATGWAAPDELDAGAVTAVSRADSVAAATPARGRGAFRALATLALQAADALDHAHGMGILHRDIKPSNLLIDATGKLWVTDFGLARFQDDPGLTRTGDLLGTLRYMAPELLRGPRMVYDPRSDIYSLGATIYELLTLRPVFDGRERQVLVRQIVLDDPIAPRRLDASIPRDLETIVLKALEKEPDRRYASARQIGEDLRRFLDEKTIRARRATLVERAAKWARRHRAVLWPAAAALFLSLLIATPLLWWERQKTARMYHDLRVTFQQADLGFTEMLRLSDELAMKGMGQFALPGGSPEPIRSEFFKQTLEFYDLLSREPQLGKAMQALAFRRLGFARMVITRDPRAEGDLKHARSLYDELLAAAPGDPQLRFAISDVCMNLGIVVMASRGMKEAEPSFQRATSIDEGLAAEFRNDPRMLDQLTDRRIQIAGWFEASQMQHDADAERGRLFEFFDKQAANAASPVRARLIAGSYLRLAGVLKTQGNHALEDRALRAGLALDQGNTALLNNLAWSLVRVPQTTPAAAAEAVKLATRATEAGPQERTFQNTLALAHLRAGNGQLARDSLEKSISMQAHGGDAADRLVMSMVCLRNGARGEALDWYIRALEWMSANPQNDADAVALRSEVEGLLGRAPAPTAKK